MMRILKYLASSILLLNITTFVANTFGIGAGSVFSALMYILLVCYAVAKKKLIFIQVLIFVGMGYFVVSGLRFYSGEVDEFTKRFLKYILVVLFGAGLASQLSKKELLYLLLLGSVSIIVHAVFFADDYGRYSGFYIDPNAAGFICIMGYGLTFGLEKSKLKSIALIAFTFAGLITFSRTFVVVWILLNLISLRLNPKNIKILFLGFGIVSLILVLAPFLNFNPIRFGQLQAIFGEEQVTQEELNEGSRTETWATFYPYLVERPIFGNGYGSFQSRGLNRVGAHNSFLLVFGEAGFLIFAIYVGFYFYLLFWGYRYFKMKPHLFMMITAQILFLMSNHNYFTSYYLIFISLWLFLEVQKARTHES